MFAFFHQLAIGRRHRRRSRYRQLGPGCGVEALEARWLLAAPDLTAATSIDVGEALAAEIGSPTEVDVFRVTLNEPGRLSLRTQADPASELDSRTSLLAPDGRLLIQSEGESTADLNDRIDQHLLAGTYFITVEGLGGASGAYWLTAEFDVAAPPHDPLLTNTWPDYPFSPQPTFIASADFNGDGHEDVAAADTFSFGITILMGLGDGSFQQARHHPIGFLPSGISADDFNGDGHPDLITDRAGGQEIVFLMGLGDGSFVESGAFQTGGTIPFGQATSDLNQDGKRDLVVNLAGSAQLGVYLGNGDGTFQEPGTYGIGHAAFSAPAVGDINGDGHADLATANLGSNNVSVLINRGDGTFADQVRLPVGPNPVGVVIADLDGDGHAELATANTGGDFVTIHWGLGDGTFGDATEHAVNLGPWGITAVDFDGDGHLDLATSNQVSNNVSVLLNRGDGTFHNPAHYRAGLQPATILARDVNGDGVSDLLTANLISHDVSVLLGRGDGTFVDDQTDVRPGPTWPQGTVGRDFNGDGHLDLATVSYIDSALFLYLGRGDGTFQHGSRFEVGSTPHGVIAEDLDGDGHLDLITANCSSANISVLMGRGDGRFADQVVYATTRSDFVELGDFDGDGNLDLITGSPFDLGIALLLGHGDGTFGDRILLAEHESPVDGIIGDFNDDGHLDVASANLFSPTHDLSVRLGRGDGTFGEVSSLPVGDRPHNVVTADFNGDGFQDLINANFGADSVSLLLGRGDGTFLDEQRFATELNPDFLLTSDFNTDGYLDLVVSNAGSNTVSILLGRADGEFDDQVPYRISDHPTPRRGLEVQDFDGDGHLDIAIVQLHGDDLVILPGFGDGRFGEPLYLALGTRPVDLVAGEFSGDGLLDVASVNPVTNELAVALGVGDATLDQAEFFEAGKGPVSVLRGDFNRDGRTDLVTANHGSHDVSVFFGLGTGAFREAVRWDVGKNPVAVVTGDFDLDGRPDLATANAGSNDISLLLATERSTFELQASMPAGDLPQAMVAGDFNRDGRPDLVTANYRSQDLTLFLGNGDGTFQQGLRSYLGTTPIALGSGDFDDDGQLDLAAANLRSGDVTVILGRGDGTFRSRGEFAAGRSPVSLAVDDFNGDGRQDLATVNAGSDDVTFLLGRGDGRFEAPSSQAVGNYPSGLLAADFNGDDRVDVAVGVQGFREVTVLQGIAELRYVPAEELADHVRATPLIADFNADGLDDVAVIGRQGKILLRLSRTAAPGVWDAPIEVAPAVFPARDLALVPTPRGQVLAALDAKSPSVSLYASDSHGTFTREAGPSLPGTLPEYLAAGDLNNDGRTDLAIAAASNEVFVYLQDVTGQFPADHDYRLAVGTSPASLDLIDIDGDLLRDIVITNQISGDVSVLRNALTQPFAVELRYRAGTSLYSLSDQGGLTNVRSAAEIGHLVPGDVNGDTRTDLIVTNSTTNTFSVLYGNGAGGFLNPQSATAWRTGSQPTVVVADRFNDDAYLDLAILNERSEDISIFLGGPDGFRYDHQSGNQRGSHLSAGNLPSGLAVRDINADGIADLLVGNVFGDLLTLFGNGDGTFQPYQRAGQNIAMAVADLNNDGEDDFIFANESMDRMYVQYSAAGDFFAQERHDGLLAPEAVASADLNRDGEPDLVVANNGANNVLVYLGDGNGRFGSANSFPAGTNPIGIAIQDLDGDQLLDLVVANEGSNDVNVLLGEGDGDTWTLANGPRLRAGAGPLSTVVHDATLDGIPDILVSNSRSDDVFLLPGVGGGFFDDQNPRIFDVGRDPGGIIPLNNGFATFNRGSNDLTVFTDFLGPGHRVSSGGLRPVAAVGGDFNGDGIHDAMVAHHGDGVVSLMLGTGNSLIQSGSFSRPDVPHPTALALGDGAEVYIAGEGQESAVLLTSFGVPVLGAATFSLSADIFVVSGPGLGSEVNIFVTSSDGELGDLPPVPFDEASDVLASVADNPQLQLQQDGAGDSERRVEDDGEVREKNNVLTGVEEAIRRAVTGEGPRGDPSGVANLLVRVADGHTPAVNAAVVPASRFVLQLLAATAASPVRFPLTLAAVDQTLAEGMASEFSAARDRVQLALSGLLSLLADAWSQTDRAAPPSSARTSANAEQPTQSVGDRADTPAVDHERNALFADPAFIALCTLMLSRAGTSPVRRESREVDTCAVQT